MLDGVADNTCEVAKVIPELLLAAEVTIGFVDRGSKEDVVTCGVPCDVWLVVSGAVCKPVVGCNDVLLCDIVVDASLNTVAPVVVC